MNNLQSVWKFIFQFQTFSQDHKTPQKKKIEEEAVDRMGWFYRTQEVSLNEERKVKMLQYAMPFFLVLHDLKALSIEVCVTTLFGQHNSAQSTNNLHWHLTTVHPSLQREEKVVEGGVNGGASVLQLLLLLLQHRAVSNHNIQNLQSSAPWAVFQKSLFPARQNSID